MAKEYDTTPLDDYDNALSGQMTVSPAVPDSATTDRMEYRFPQPASISKKRVRFRFVGYGKPMPLDNETRYVSCD